MEEKTMVQLEKGKITVFTEQAKGWPKGDVAEKRSRDLKSEKSAIRVGVWNQC